MRPFKWDRSASLVLCNEVGMMPWKSLHKQLLVCILQIRTKRNSGSSAKFNWPCEHVNIEVAGCCANTCFP